MTCGLSQVLNIGSSSRGSLDVEEARRLNQTSQEAAHFFFVPAAKIVSVFSAGVPRGLRVRREICRKDPGGGVQGMPGAGEHSCSVLLLSQSLYSC